MRMGEARICTESGIREPGQEKCMELWAVEQNWWAPSMTLTQVAGKLLLAMD